MKTTDNNPIVFYLHASELNDAYVGRDVKQLETHDCLMLTGSTARSREFTSDEVKKFEKICQGDVTPGAMLLRDRVGPVERPLKTSMREDVDHINIQREKGNLKKLPWADFGKPDDVNALLKGITREHFGTDA